MCESCRLRPESGRSEEGRFTPRRRRGEQWQPAESQQARDTEPPTTPEVGAEEKDGAIGRWMTRHVGHDSRPSRHGCWNVDSVRSVRGVAFPQHAYRFYRS